MSKIKVDYSLSKTTEFLNLEDYGYENSITWEDLTDEERDEITDQLRQENIPTVEVVTVK